MNLLQRDAAIYPGYCVGALVDSSGAVIGINSSKYADTSVEGMGFAIPINTAIPIINDIVKAQTVSEDEQAYLGIKGTNVNLESGQYYNLPVGIYVSSVTSGSPADKAGIKKGYVIVKYKGKDVTTMDGLQEKMALCKAGDKAEITVKRAVNGEYKSITCNVTLGKKSDAPERTENSSDNGNSSSDSNSGQNGSSGQYDNNGQYGGNNNGSLFN